MRTGKAPKPATCVCPPLDKGFHPTVSPPTFSTRQGPPVFEKAPNAATCVCPPLDKGFSTATPSTVFPPPFSTTFYRQGRQARHIYLTQRSYDVSREVRADHSHVPAIFSTSCHPTFPRFDSWFFHDTFPTNRFPTAAFSRTRESLPLQSRTNNLFNLQVN